MTGRDFAHSMIASVGLHQIHHYLSVVRNQPCAPGRCTVLPFAASQRHASCDPWSSERFQHVELKSSWQVDSMPDSLKTAKVSQDGFQTFATLWRNVHSLAVATDLHYNSMGFFRKADFKARLQPPALTVLICGSMLTLHQASQMAKCITANWLDVFNMHRVCTAAGGQENHRQATRGRPGGHHLLAV